jgi:hypothetical protein
MSRLPHIREKLKYVERQRQTLMDALFDAKKKQSTPDYFCHTVADILGSSRECYDYCAKDIFEEKIIPNTSNNQLITRFQAGKVHAYFPFYRKELENAQNPFYKLSFIDFALHQHLLKIADDIQSGSFIPNTLFKYSDIELLRNLVNEKKHDRLIAIESNDNQEVLIENKSFKMILPIKEQKGWNPFHVKSDSEVSRVAEFRLEAIDVEISKFCTFAQKSTTILIEEIYAKFF